jgi:hypothetical protein
MPHLVAPLISGIVGAANGTAEFFAAGTAVLSTSVYADADGRTPVTTTTLDANGSAVRYLNERCDVLVKSSQGATVRQWTEGTDARLVRVENVLFTGPNVNGNGQVVPAGRTTLHDDLTLFRESMAADDALVNINGVEYRIAAALGSAGSVYVNVRTGYGAQGNGTADDTSQIQSAINAAQNAGGGVVFFPAGTYRITGNLTVTSSVTLLGASCATAVIKQATSGLANPWLLISASFVTVSNLAIQGLVGTETGTCLGISGAGTANIYFEQLQLGGHAGACFSSSVSGSSETSCTMSSCRLTASTTTSSWVSNTSNQVHQFVGCTLTTSVVPSGALLTGTRVFFTNCSLSMRSTSGGVAVLPNDTRIVVFTGCQFFSNNTSGTNAIGGTSSGQELVMTGCRFEQASGGTLNLSGGAGLYETGGSFQGLGTIAIPSGLALAGFSTGRDRRKVQTTVNGTSYTPNVDFGLHVVTHASGAAMAFNNPTNSSYDTGNPLVIQYLNNSGGAITPSWGSQFDGVPATAVNNGTRAMYVFMRDGSNWVSLTTNPVIGYT